MSESPAKSPARSCLEQIISGGQTGADRGALDAALKAGFPLGGYCPIGRMAEDGAIDARYPLVELGKARYKRSSICSIRHQH